MFHGVDKSTRRFLTEQALLIHTAHASSHFSHSLYIKHTGTVMGYGLYSNCTIPAGLHLFFYSSEVIRSPELSARRRDYDKR